MLTQTFIPARRFAAHATLAILASLPLASFAMDATSATGHPGEQDHMHHHGMKMTGNADYDFAMMMKKHHEQGVKMAQDELNKGKDPEVRAAAQKIIDSQKKEIADFEKWLTAHPQK